MNSKLSRRSIFIPAGTAPKAQGATATASLPATDANGLSASDRAIFAISSSDSRFQSAVGGLFPGLQNDPVFQKIAPLAILITLQNGPAIRAHSVAWQITTPTGSFDTALFSYVSPGSATKGYSVSTLGSARHLTLQPGQSRLVTPFFDWSSSSFQSNPRPNWSTALKLAEPGGFLISELPTATAVRVSLDAAVFSDWKLMGPDRYNLARRLRSRRNAEHDEGLVVYRLLKAGAPNHLIVQTLRSHASAARSSTQNLPLFWYEQARRYQAQVLLRAFGDADRHSFMRAVHRLVTQKNTVITRVSA